MMINRERRSLSALGLAVMLSLVPCLGHAQAIGTPVNTNPIQVSSVSASGAIAATGTFQSVFAPSGALGGQGTRARLGCLIENTGTNTLYVFVGPIAGATEAKSYQLATGATFSCSTGAGGVLQDQISVTGTATDTFAADSQ